MLTLGSPSTTLPVSCWDRSWFPISGEDRRVYRERPSRVPGAFVWNSSVTEGQQTRVLPDGCMDFIWVGGRVMIAGPDTQAVIYSTGTRAQVTGLRFAPGFAPGVIGIPAHEFTDTRAFLDEVWPAAVVDQLVDQLHRSQDPGLVLENLALRRYDDTHDPTVAQIVRHVRNGSNTASIAEAVGFSERQLHRRCLKAFGYGAKRLARILRMERALDLARNGMAFAQAASDAGYADQSHLARDVLELAGLSLSQLLAESGRSANSSTELPSGS